MFKWLKEFLFGPEVKMQVSKPVPTPIEKKKPGRRPGIKTRKTSKR